VAPAEIPRLGRPSRKNHNFKQETERGRRVTIDGPLFNVHKKQAGEIRPCPVDSLLIIPSPRDLNNRSNLEGPRKIFNVEFKQRPLEMQNCFINAISISNCRNSSQRT
jgi:hypothetical protein